MSGLPCPCLMLVTEARPGLAGLVAAAVAGGVNAVYWRDRSSAAGLKSQAAALRAAAPAPVRLLQTAAAGAPEATGADGLHLSEQENCAFLPPLWGRSVHSVARAEEAAREGAAYLLAGTIFASPSHPNIRSAGLDFLQAVCLAVAIPVIAIGGVTAANAATCLDAGAAGVAVLSPILHAVDPRAAAAAYRRVLDPAAPAGKTTGREGENAMMLTINGDAREVTAGTLGEFLDQCGLPSRLVVVERNGLIVPREQYAETPLAPGDVLEIVQMMAGG